MLKEKMLKEKMLELVKGQLDAYNKRDLEKFCTFFHPQVKAFSLPQNSQICEGMTQFREVYKNRFDSSPELHCEIKNRIVLSQTIIDEEWVMPDGMHVAAIYSFKDDLIHQVWFSR